MSPAAAPFRSSHQAKIALPEASTSTAGCFWWVESEFWFTFLSVDPHWVAPEESSFCAKMSKLVDPLRKSYHVTKELVPDTATLGSPWEPVSEFWFTFLSVEPHWAVPAEFTFWA